MTQTTETTTDADLLALFGEHGNGTLMTVQPDGRPQASVVSYAFDRNSRTLRISITEPRVKTRNLRRDARASFMVVHPEMHSWVVGEGTATLTPPAATQNDPTTEAMVALFREVMGEHPDWPAFRAAMVAERRMVVTLPLDHLYGLTGATA